MYRVLIVCLTCIELWYENAVVVMILQIGENCIIRILKMLVMRHDSGQSVWTVIMDCPERTVPKNVMVRTTLR